MKRYTTLLILACAAFCTWSQDLSTEITVDRTVQPVIRDASRLNGLSPVIVAPDIKAYHLQGAEYTAGGTLTSEASMLPPASWPDSAAHARYRGYASVGYLPLFNLGANVGYRFVDTPRYGLGLWAQYNGNSYNGDIPYFNGALFTNHVATVGGDFSIRFGSQSLLTGKGTATLKRIRIPYYLGNSDEEFRRSYQQGVREVNAEAKWLSRADRLIYSFKGGLGYFGFTNDIPKELKRMYASARQITGDFGFSLGLADDDSAVPWVGIDADFQGIYSSHLRDLNSVYTMAYVTNKFGVGTATPYLRFGNSTLQGRIGANVCLGINRKGKLHVAPEAQIEWRPFAPLSLYAHATGGEHLNTMKHVVELNPYIVPTLAYDRTNIPLALTGGINIGPYDGMSLSLFGGYAKARDLLSPFITIMRDGNMKSYFEYADTDSWYFGGSLSYAYLNWFVLSASVKYGESDRSYNSWYEWIDGAKVVSDISLQVFPIEHLNVCLSYNMRYDRKARALIYPYNQDGIQLYSGTPNLGTVNDVNLSGQYQINDRITAFLSAENILNQHYKLISGMPAQGIRGLLGVSCKF